MARVLKQFEFTGTRRGKGKWHEWCDGQIWELKRGEDFTSDVKRMKQQAYSRARNRGKKARVNIVDENTVVMQCYERNGDE